MVVGAGLVAAAALLIATGRAMSLGHIIPGKHEEPHVHEAPSAHADPYIEHLIPLNGFACAWSTFGQLLDFFSKVRSTFKS